MEQEIDLDQKVCRICLTTDSEFRSIYRKGKILEQNVRLCDILAECTSLKFVENDGLPDVVCSKCLLHLSRIQAFRQLAFQSNFILRRKVKYVEVKEAKELKCANEGSIVYLIQQRSDQDENDTEEYTMVVEEEHEIEEEAEMAEPIEIVDYTEDYNPSESSSNEQRSGEDSEEDAEYIDMIDETAEEGATVLRRRRNPEDSTRKTECEICGKMLSNNSSLKYHMQLHSDKTPFECPKCREKFKTRNAYDGHMTTHMENPNKCDICGKTYRQAASLRSHMLNHENKKPFVCEICGKGMTQKSGYKKHMLLHTGDKPHSCDFCEKTFRYKSNLLCHRRTHSNERNYPCDQCDKRFLGSEQLKRHKAIHTGEKPFKCNQCNKCFNRKGTLQKHGKLHDKKDTSTSSKSKR